MPRRGRGEPIACATGGNTPPNAITARSGFRAFTGGSGIDQTVEDAADGWVDGECSLVSGGGVRDIDPIGAETCRNGIGLSLETPANVVGGPGKDEEAARGGVGDRNGGGADDPERSICGEGVGIPSHTLTGDGGYERCESATVAIRAK
jgi:hypothetical protein